MGKYFFNNHDLVNLVEHLINRLSLLQQFEMYSKNSPDSDHIEAMIEYSNCNKDLNRTITLQYSSTVVFETNLKELEAICGTMNAASAEKFLDLCEEKGQSIESVCLAFQNNSGTEETQATVYIVNIRMNPYSDEHELTFESKPVPNFTYLLSRVEQKLQKYNL